jgi:diadenosine tetraphosphate (Ap4A) HIT family hydrolase
MIIMKKDKFRIVIIIDTREKKNEHIIEKFKKNGVEYEHKKLEFGDYSFKIVYDNGEEVDYSNTFTIERKQDLNELAQNLGVGRERFVKELETGYVVIGDNQHFKGYTLFLCKKHKTELFQLGYSEKMKFLEEMSVVAEAVAKAFNAEKMNYELLGNGDTHIHWHLFPRVSGDLENYGNNGKGPVWWYPMDKMYNSNNRPTEKELKILKAKLEKELNQLL